MGRPPSDRRARILTAATHCFITQSFPDVKLDQVASQAGVAKGTIYLYFRSKEELFCECLLDDTPRWYEQIERIITGQGTATDRLSQLVFLQAEAYAKKGPLIQNFIQMGPTLSLSSDVIARLHDHLRQVVELDSRLFQEGIESGEFSDRFTAAQMAIIFMQIFDLNLKFQMFKVPLFNPQDVFAALLKLFGTQ